MNPDPETRCGACGHPRRIHAVTLRLAQRVGCIAAKVAGSVEGCACIRLQTYEPFDRPGEEQ